MLARFVAHFNCKMSPPLAQNALSRFFNNNIFAGRPAGSASVNLQSDEAKILHRRPGMTWSSLCLFWNRPLSDGAKCNMLGRWICLHLTC